MIKLFIILIISFIYPFQRGNLVSIDLIETESIEQIQSELDDAISEFGVNVFYGGHIYRVLYETLDGFGDSTIASGVIAIPNSENEAFGVLSWQHGTQIYRDGVLSNNGFDILSRIAVASGYVFIATDYLGLGVSDDIHPYIIKDPTANSVIDMIRATRNYFEENLNLQLNNQLSLFGYSEGGYATLAAQMVIEQDFPEEFDLMLSFPMAGPYDLSGTMMDKMLDGEYYAEPFYLPYLLNSYIHYYDLGPLDEFFLPEFANDMPDLFSGNYGGGYINDYMNDNEYNPPILSLIPEVVSEFIEDDNYILRQLLNQNDLYDWSPQTTTYLFHGIADHLVPYENSIVAYDHFIENGATDIYLELLPETFGNHQNAAPYAILGAFNVIESMKQINPKGDISHDENIDISDVLMCVNIILTTQNNWNQYELWAADIDQNEIINVVDVLYMVGIIINTN